MSEKDKDTTWKGKKYLKHLGDAVAVIKPTSQAQIERFRKNLEWFIERLKKDKILGKGEHRAEVISEAGEKSFFTGSTLKALWATVSGHLILPESKWLEFTIYIPCCSEFSPFSNFRIENPRENTSQHTWESDGTRVIHGVTYPAVEGETLKLPKTPPFKVYLENLKEKLSTPLPEIFFDSYYSEEELRELGVKNRKTFWKHAEKTQGEERWRFQLFDKDNNEVWSEISSDYETHMARSEEKFKELRSIVHSFHSERIDRSLAPRQHPLFIPQLYTLSAVIHALEMIAQKGEDSPEAKALQQGFELREHLADLQSLARAPEALKNPNLARPPKGRQKHEVKRKKTENLKREAKEIIRTYEKAGNSLKPSEIVDRLKKFRTGETLKHPHDERGFTVSNFQKKIIPQLRNEVLAE